MTFCYLCYLRYTSCYLLQSSEKSLLTGWLKPDFMSLLLQAQFFLEVWQPERTDETAKRFTVTVMEVLLSYLSIRILAGWMSVGEVNPATHRALVPPDLRTINSVRERGLLRSNHRMQLQIRVITRHSTIDSQKGFLKIHVWYTCCATIRLSLSNPYAILRNKVPQFMGGLKRMESPSKQSCIVFWQSNLSNSSEMVFREVSCAAIKVEETSSFVIWHLGSSGLVFVSILNAMKM